MDQRSLGNLSNTSDGSARKSHPEFTFAKVQGINGYE